MRRALLILVLAAAACRKAETGDTDDTDVSDTDTDADADTDADSDTDTDADTDTDTDPDTDDTDVTPPVPPGDVLGPTSGGGDAVTGAFSARVVIGEPAARQSLSTSRYQLSIGIGAVRPVEAP